MGSQFVRIAGASGLVRGETRPFALPGVEEKGFLLGTSEGVKAYRNRCGHWPAPLDMDDDEYWNEELDAVVCKIHGARFRAEDGHCFLGPCRGAGLESFLVHVDGEDVVVEVPEPRIYARG